MTLRTGLIITGDTQGAQKALNELTSDFNKTAGAAKQLGDAERSAEAATESLGTELRQTAAAAGTVQAELERAGLSVDQLMGSVAGMSREAQKLTIAENRLASAALALAAAQEKAAAAATGSAAEQQAAARAVASAEVGLAAAKLGVAEAQQAAARAGGTNVRSMGEQALGARMLGQQFQDMALMMSMSGVSVQSVLRALSVQAGQTALAIEQMGVKGAIGRTAAFLGSPWGSIILGATMVLGPYVASLFETAKAADLAKEGTSQLGQAQSAMADLFGKASSKISEQNDLLRVNARLKAINLRAEAQQLTKSSDAVFGDAGKVSWMDWFQPDAQGLRGTATGQRNTQNLANIVASMRSGKIDQETALRLSETQDFTGVKITREQFQQAIVDRATSAANTAIASLIDQSLNDGKVAPGLSKPGTTKKPKSTASRDEFGRDTADRIASITEAFSETPPAVQQADKAVRQLDDLIDDLGRKKPPNFEALIASAKEAKQQVETGLLRSIQETFAAPETLAEKADKALGTLDGMVAKKKGMLTAGLIDQATFDEFDRRVGAAKGNIEASLVRPYNDFLASQEQSLAILQLQARGQNDQAEALRTIYSLEKGLRPLRDDQKDAILASVQALRAEQREVEILRQETQKYVDALGSIEGIVSDATQAFVRGDLGTILKSPEKLLDAFATLKGQKIFDDLFAGVFRDLQDQVNGTSIVRDASTRMATAVDSVSASTTRTGKALDSLTRAADAASRAVGGSGSGNAALSGGIAAIASRSASAVGKSVADTVSAALGSVQEVTVTASRQTPMNPEALITKAISGVAGAFFSLVSNPEAAKKIGDSIGKAAGKGIEGAANGTMVAGVSNSLGLKVDTTGAQIGGATANLLSAIPGLAFLGGPIGAIGGSLLGGLIGNLFKSTPRGSAQITSVDGQAVVNGNSAEIKTDLGNLAGSVQSAIGKIADTLGADVGSFAVSINKYKDSYRVDPSGGTSVGGKYGNKDGVLKFDNDPEGAVRAAIANAISDGAIKGLSGAVQQALQSSSDIDKALSEAVKVQNVELLAGGLQAQWGKAFKDFETQAAERVRIARQYGFDVVAIEKENAKEREALQKQLLDAQVGSLQRLVDEMTSGSLFEGTAVDRRSALLEQIDKAQADLNAGVEGAADTLANLYDQLNSVSKEVYGTTGGFAVDRAAILDQARTAIAKANADITAAQAKTSDPALATTNAALDENNDQNAKILDAIERQSALLEQALNATGGGLGYLYQLAKTS